MPRTCSGLIDLTGEYRFIPMPFDTSEIPFPCPRHQLMSVREDIPTGGASLTVGALPKRSFGWMVATV